MNLRVSRKGNVACDAPGLTHGVNRQTVGDLIEAQSWSPQESAYDEAIRSLGFINNLSVCGIFTAKGHFNPV